MLRIFQLVMGVLGVFMLSMSAWADDESLVNTFDQYNKVLTFSPNGDQSYQTQVQLSSFLNTQKGGGQRNLKDRLSVMTPDGEMFEFIQTNELVNYLNDSPDALSLHWSGQLASDRMQSVSLTAISDKKSDDVFLFGALFLDDRTYEFSVSPEGNQIMSLLNPDVDHICGTEEEAHRHNGIMALSEELMPEVKLTQSATTYINVMVLWTPTAEANAGGRIKIQALAQSAVNLTNTALSNSHASVRLQLKQAPVTNPLSGMGLENGNGSSVLTALRGTGLADLFKVDLVHVIVESFSNPDLSGIAYLPDAQFSDANDAYAISKRDSLLGRLTFSHEVGHNLGVRHHNQPANSLILRGGKGLLVEDTWYPGGDVNEKIFKDIKFGTVVTSGGFCGAGCRIPYFSNPNITYAADVPAPPYLEYALGSHDYVDPVNATQVINSAKKVACYRSPFPSFCGSYDNSIPVTHGLYHNPVRPGWGLHIKERSNVATAVWFTFDVAGKPTWYVTNLEHQRDNNWVGYILGSRLSPGSAGPAHISICGMANLKFNGLNNADFTFHFDPIQSTTLCNQMSGSEAVSLVQVDGPYGGMWYDPSASGWGISVAKDLTLLFHFKDNGLPVWSLGYEDTGNISMYNVTSSCQGCNYVAPQHQLINGTYNQSFLNTGQGKVTIDLEGAYPWPRSNEHSSRKPILNRTIYNLF